MRQALIVLTLGGILVSTAQTQSVYLSVSGGFSRVRPPSNYAFTYTSDRISWPGTFEEIIGQKADVGFHFGTALEFRLAEVPLSVMVGMLYTELYGKSDYVKAYTPPWYSSIYTVGELTTRTNILTFETGLEWEFVKSPIGAYVSLGLLYNVLGDTKLKITYTGGSAEAIVSGNTRVGLSAGGGVRLPLDTLLDATIGGEYSWINLITPESQEAVKGILRLTVGIHYKLL